MLKTFRITLIASIILGIMASGKKCSETIEEGIYTGTFKVVYDTGTFSGKATLALKELRYHSEGNDNRIPAGGSGTYSVDKDRITFEDENMWTADFDWNLILRGEYLCTFDETNLKLSARRNNGAYYEYDLIKK